MTKSLEQQISELHDALLTLLYCQQAIALQPSMTERERWASVLREKLNSLAQVEDKSINTPRRPNEQVS
jgi:hypothetical protein